MGERSQSNISMRETVVFPLVINLVVSKFYLITLENNQTDIPHSNSYDENDYDVIAEENHDYQDCPLPFNPCPSGITCIICWQRNVYYSSDGTHWDCVSELCVPDYDYGAECPPPSNRCPLATHWDCHHRRCVTSSEAASCPPPSQACQPGKHWNCHTEECVPHARHLPHDILDTTIKIMRH